MSTAKLSIPPQRATTAILPLSALSTKTLELSP
jgi:hypothetical protein